MNTVGGELCLVLKAPFCGNNVQAAVTMFRPQRSDHRVVGWKHTGLRRAPAGAWRDLHPLLIDHSARGRVKWLDQRFNTLAKLGDVVMLQYIPGDQICKLDPAVIF